MISKTQRTVLRSYLRSLDRDHRYTLMLHHVDQLTPREISMVLDRPYAWVVAALERLNAEVRALMQSPSARSAPPASLMRSHVV